jgi:flavin reductase (DIM6/NTAB) family NADH-FMN oxidoreductase RutF
MTLDESEFRIACGHFATGVAIVTMRDRAGQGHGFTANSFASVSLNPPLVLVCVDKTISSHPPMTETEGFVVNILTEQQEELARRFATPDIDKFEGVTTVPGEYGAPRIPDCLAYLAAVSHSRHDGGDHTIFIGEATGCELGRGRPLIFYQGMYGLPGGGFRGL